MLHRSRPLPALLTLLLPSLNFFSVLFASSALLLLYRSNLFFSLITICTSSLHHNATLFLDAGGHFPDILYSDYVYTKTCIWNELRYDSRPPIVEKLLCIGCRCHLSLNIVTSRFPTPPPFIQKKVFVESIHVCIINNHNWLIQHNNYCSS